MGGVLSCVCAEARLRPVWVRAVAREGVRVRRRGAACDGFLRRVSSGRSSSRASSVRTFSTIIELWLRLQTLAHPPTSECLCSTPIRTGHTSLIG